MTDPESVPAAEPTAAPDPAPFAGVPAAPPAPFAGVPAGPPPLLVPAAPVKPKAGKRVLTTIVSIVVAIVVAVGLFALKSVLFPTKTVSDFQVGKCVDQLSTSTTVQQTAVPNVVDCSDSSAKAKIIGVYDGKSVADADTSCPSATIAALELTKTTGGTTLVCLGSN
jgi:hypothetical protein